VPAPALPARFRAAVPITLLATAVTGAALTGLSDSAHADPVASVTAPVATAVPPPVVGPAVLTLAVGARSAAPRANVPASVRLVAPGGQGVAGATVTFWMTPPKRPAVRIAAARAMTDATGRATVRLRMTVTERVSASAAYGPRVLGSGARLPAGTASAPQVATVRVVVPPAARVLALAASLAGRPYVWGAAGPRRFDCSGYTMYVFAHALGRHLPHLAQAQYGLAHKVPRSAVRPGDLVFFLSGGHAYHVGIYAGHGLIWHAPHPGDHVRLGPIRSSSWVAGRVI
jgi:cell wall-associated NlpC family hydrolase